MSADLSLVPAEVVQTIDPQSAWRSLSPAAQAQIGSAAIAYMVGSIGADVLPPSDDAKWFEVAEIEGWEALKRAVVERVLAAGEALPRPTLGALGIRQCSDCGCTDNVACLAGCVWIGANRCSQCRPKALRAEAVEP